MQELAQNVVQWLIDIIQPVLKFMYVSLFWVADKLSQLLLATGIIDSEGVALGISIFIMLLVPVFIFGKIFGFDHLGTGDGGE